MRAPGIKLYEQGRLLLADTSNGLGLTTTTRIRSEGP